jgi:hypothetical protein
MIKYKIYCDMDGVIADFDKRFKQYTNMTPTEYKIKYSIPMFYNFVNNKGIEFWTSIPWTIDGKKLWNYIKKYQPTLISVPTHENSSFLGKKMWVENNIPNTPLILTPRKNKQDYAKPNAILIDDRFDTIHEWNMKGGKGILFTSAEQTINEIQKIFGNAKII